MIQHSIKFILDQFEFFFPKDEFMNLDASKQSLSYEEIQMIHDLPVLLCWFLLWPN